MSHEDVQRVVSEVVPCCHMEWPDTKPPKPPFACYMLDFDTPIGADDIQIAVRHKWIVELYETRTDAALEQRLAQALRDEFGTVSRDESYIENDNLLLVTYTFYQIEGEFDG